MAAKCLLCFNSLQVEYKLFSSVSSFSSSPRFNSLQVEYKPFYSLYRKIDTTCFNSLQVEYKPGFLGTSKQAPCRFNSLQVEYKHRLDWLYNGFMKIVSIPYRQSTNNVFENQHAIAISRFNSLQVEYKQYKEKRFYCFLFKFQFLIGRVQTASLAKQSFYEKRFQFLIGRVQTTDRTKKAFKEKDVSIPYRQSTNIRSIYGQWDNSRFQFLIGRVQTNSVPEH